MANLEHNTQEELRAMLESLETAISKPIVAGELDDWAAEIQNAWSSAVEHIRQHTADLHPRQYQQMAKEDAEMLPRVEKLKAEDAAIEEDAEVFSRLINNFVTRVPQAEPDENKLERQTAAIVESGVALVHRAKKHEVALRTWFLEAFNRDRGVAD